MGFCKCNFKKVLTFHIKGSRQDESQLLLQVVNIQKSVSVLYSLPTLFWRCIDIFPDGTDFDACMIGFLQSRSLVDAFGNEEILDSIFPSVGHLSAINNVIQAALNSVVEILKSFALLGAGWDVVCKFLAEGALATVV